MKLKYVLVGAVVLAVFLVGGLWLFLRQVPPSDALDSFQQACIEGQRRNVSGDMRPLDDQSEARMLAYCNCVAQEVQGRLTQQDIAAIGLEQRSQAIEATLHGIFALCRTRNP